MDDRKDIQTFLGFDPCNFSTYLFLVCTYLASEFGCHLLLLPQVSCSVIFVDIVFIGQCQMIICSCV